MVAITPNHVVYDCIMNSSISAVMLSCYDFFIQDSPPPYVSSGHRGEPGNVAIYLYIDYSMTLQLIWPSYIGS